MGSKYCHCCHQPRGWEDLVQCVGSTKKGRGHAWCYRCISTWLNLSPLFMKSLEKDGKGWICPKCDGSGCPCSTCRPKSKGEGDRRHKPLKIEPPSEVRATAPRSQLPHRHPGPSRLDAFHGTLRGGSPSEEKESPPVDPYADTRSKSRRKQSAPKRSPEPSVDTDILPPKKRFCHDMRRVDNSGGSTGMAGMGGSDGGATASAGNSGGSGSGDGGSGDGSDRVESEDSGLNGNGNDSDSPRNDDGHDSASPRSQPGTPSKDSVAGREGGLGHEHAEGGGSVCPSDGAGSDGEGRRDENGHGAGGSGGRWLGGGSGAGGKKPAGGAGSGGREGNWEELKLSVKTLLGDVPLPPPPAAVNGVGGADLSSPSSEVSELTPSKKAKTANAPTKSAAEGVAGDGSDKFRAFWEPPPSPYGLIQESLYTDPWKVMLACMLLNKTSGAQVRSVIYELFKVIPTPQAAVDAEVDVIEMMVQPLGLFRKRARSIQRFSKEYLEGAWASPTQLHGVGKYGGDSYQIFVRGEWRSCQPEDKELKKYVQFLHDTEGLGTGLEREAGPTPAVTTPAVSHGAPPITLADNTSS